MFDTQKQRITVDIFGDQYTIVGSETSSHIRLVASLVDEKMHEISTKNPSLDISRLAVLTAVNAVNDYVKLKNRVEQLEQELKRVKD
ncbi:cell division protein ZapA [Cytobacillus sp. Hz8]|uniref:cell division protein ZapA n=1 Tax=Cytobacillus sp. Hz8 TaxID=3347168 RepID=UPI0035DA4A48